MVKPSPICVDCAVEMRCEKNGFIVLMSDGEDGGSIWATDKYKCPHCHHEVVHGFSHTCCEAWREPELFARYIERGVDLTVVR